MGNFLNRVQNIPLVCGARGAASRRAARCLLLAAKTRSRPTFLASALASSSTMTVACCWIAQGACRAAAGCWVCGMHCWHTRASVWIATSFPLRPRAGHHRPLRHTPAHPEREREREISRERESSSPHTHKILCVHVFVTAVTYAAHHTWPER